MDVWKYLIAIKTEKAPVSVSALFLFWSSHFGLQTTQHFSDQWLPTTVLYEMYWLDKYLLQTKRFAHLSQAEQIEEEGVFH